MTRDYKGSRGRRGGSGMSGSAGLMLGLAIGLGVAAGAQTRFDLAPGHRTPREERQGGREGIAHPADFTRRPGGFSPG